MQKFTYLCITNPLPPILRSMSYYLRLHNHNHKTAGAVCSGNVISTVKPLLTLASWTLPLQNNFKVQNKQFQTPSTSSIFSSSSIIFALSGGSCGRLQVNHQQLPPTNLSLSFCDIWDTQRKHSLLERRHHPDMSHVGRGVTEGPRKYCCFIIYPLCLYRPAVWGARLENNIHSVIFIVECTYYSKAKQRGSQV